MNATNSDLLKKWIMEVNPEVQTIDRHDDIIDQRMVTSLQFVSFLLYIEQLRGAPIDIDDLDLDTLRTLADIETNFFGDASGDVIDGSPGTPTDITTGRS